MQNKMKRLSARQGILILTLVFCSIISAGCTGFLPSLGGTTTIQQSVQGTEHFNLPFTDARDQFRMLQDGKKGESSYILHSVQGNQVDESGGARSWVFGVTSGAERQIIVFSRDSVPEVQQWKGTMPGSEIDLGSVVLPGDLFSRRAAVIKGLYSDTRPSDATLELKDDVYTFSVDSGGKTVVYRFDPRSGEMIHS